MTPGGIAAQASRSAVLDIARRRVEVSTSQGAPTSPCTTSGITGGGMFGMSSAKIWSKGKLPCAPTMNVPSGMTRVWHIAQATLPRSTFPFSRTTQRANGMVPSAATGTRCLAYHAGSRTCAGLRIGPLTSTGISNTSRPTAIQSASVRIAAASKTISGSAARSRSM